MRLKHFVLFVAGVLSCACRSEEFDPQSKVESVRILATAADEPYARPGDTVTVQALAFDGRDSQPKPMGISWLPDPCINPFKDAYYDCYAAFAQQFSPGVDLTPQLVSTTSSSFQVPADVIASHAAQGDQEPYGVAFAFVMACAGHVEYTPPEPGAPVETPPFSCFDDAHAKLGPDDFVFAYSLVYAFDQRTNANPEIDHLEWQGSAVDATLGITVDHCTEANLDDCPKTSLDTAVDASNQEQDPSDLDANGNPLREEIWVDYYLTAGKVKHDSIVLFDPRKGLLGNSAVDLSAPQTPGTYSLWAVLHDNRGGVSWLEVPLTAF
jgi:hypothetical protein